MQVKDAHFLQGLTAGQPCEHPDWDKEYYLGADTGDRVCSSCGCYLSREECQAIDQRKVEAMRAKR